MSAAGEFRPDDLAGLIRVRRGPVTPAVRDGAPATGGPHILGALHRRLRITVRHLNQDDVALQGQAQLTGGGGVQSDVLDQLRDDERGVVSRYIAAAGKFTDGDT